MELTQKDIDQLEAYHFGELSASAEAELRARLVEDPVFQLAVKEWEALWISGVMPTSAEEEEWAHRKQQLRDTEAKLPPIHPQSAASKWWLWGILIVSLILAVWYVWPSEGTVENIPPDQESTEGRNRPQFQAFDASFFTHLTRDGANLGDTQEEALTTYDAREYSAAWSLLLEQVQQGADSILLLYAGVAALADQELLVATSALTPLLDSPSFVFYQEEIQWYLALTFLEQGNQAKGQQLLEQLIVTKSTYASKAIELQRK